MAKRVQRRVSRLRRIFRWCRISVWLVILAILIAGIYLNTVGLPDFLKQPLLAKFRAKGVQLDFDRMRLRWYRGIVVDHATFTFLKHPLQPKFYSEETELNPDLHSLRDSSLKLKSLSVKEGKLVWPFSKTNSGAFTLNQINAQIRFRPDNEIEIEQFDANFADTKITVSGSLTNAIALRDWKIFQSKKPHQGKNGLQKFAAVLNKIHFTGSPEIKLQFNGDAAAPDTFTGKFSFAAAAVKTPWGNGTNLELTSELRDFSQSSGYNFIRWKADSAETSWGSASNFHGVAKLSMLSSNTFQTDLNIYAKQFQNNSGRADSIHLTAQTPLSFTNLIPTHLAGKINLIGAETKFGKAATAEISISATTNSAPKIADESWANWRRAEPISIIWKSRFSKIESQKLKVESFSCAGTWHAPELQISALDAQLYDGKINANADLNIATREAHVKGSSDFDVLKLSPVLTPFVQRWLGKFTWEKPPQLAGEASAILPAWTNHSPNWNEEVLPTLQLAGHAAVERGTYREVSATSAQTDFAFSNLVWTLPNLRVNRPEGGADLSLVSDDRSQEFHWQIHSEIDPKAFRHLLTEEQQHVFDDFQFASPPIIHADLTGHWHEMENSSLMGDLTVTNFSFRSNVIEKFTAGLQFTNRILSVNKMRIDRQKKFISAEKVELNFPLNKIFFTDVYGTDDPYLVTRLIGRKVAANIAPYQFAEPPAVHLNGSLSLTNIDDADMHFLVDGGTFKWKNLNADKISGRLDWVGQTLLVTNVYASAYHKGTIEGWAYFDFAPINGTDFHFDFAGADLDLSSLVADLSGKTNRLEGSLHGQFTLDSGNTRDPKTWKAHGRVNLRDGLLWDVPLFGIFSPLLNALLPGAGNSRAREATAEYLVRDGMIFSDDLEIRSATLRLDYRGRVDFDQNVDARVEAELLRDAWIIGPVVSLVFSPLAKIFEYKVTGTLSDPKSEPVYIPNFLMMTLRPFHSLKEALTPNKPLVQPAANPPAESKP